MDNQQTAMAGRVTGIQSDILVDRISDLPDNVMDCIMSKLTLLDAVRTSVVSKKWRHCWTWARKLEFDMDFFRDVIYNKNLELRNVVDSVLTQHRGPIYKFLLHACNSFSPKESLDISQWLTLLSEKGIKELYLLAYMFSRISISSELFKCPSLERATLCNCEITCLDSHGSFGNLVYLNLDSVIISDEALELLISKFPLLETLALTFRACGRPFVVNAPQLKALAFYSVMCSRPLCLSEFPSLTAVHLMSELVIPVNFYEEPMLYRFICMIPKLEQLVLDGVALQSLAVGNIPKQISRTADHLKHLDLQLIDSSSLDQIKCAFCLIRSSPNLQSLVLLIKKSADPTKRLTPADIADFLEGQTKEGKLSGLKTVRFMRYVGCSYELRILKVILSCCPELESVYFEFVRLGTRKYDCSAVDQMISYIDRMV